MRLYIAAAVALMAMGCHAAVDRNTIASLRENRIEVREEKLEGGLEKAMQSYQRFLEETPDSVLAPEAIRRLADLKIEKEYGTLIGSAQSAGSAIATLPAPTADDSPKKTITAAPAGNSPVSAPTAEHGESTAEFEKRVMLGEMSPMAFGREAGADLERPGAREAVELYQKLLKEYPMYERNDQVLYQMSRAYEELGQVEDAMTVMDRLVRQCPDSHYLDEVQFRRAEHFFMRRRYLEAEDAYKSIVAMGSRSTFYELALYKLGWTFYKQELYEEGLHRFVALLDYKVAAGFDFDQIIDESEKKRLDDTFRVVSLSFSNLGGADSVVSFFNQNGPRGYEDRVYSHLAEFYFDKQRYADAGSTYQAFISRNPFHRKSPNFHMRVIEIHVAGGFPSLVLEAKKSFATTYGLTADYWQHFQPAERADVLGYLKTNLTDLANHYHACYQNPEMAQEKPANLAQALHWYREFLASFPQAEESPVINYQLADLLLENRSFDQAAREYEITAYDYPSHEKAPAAGYASVYAYREHLLNAAEQEKEFVQREIVRTSLKFADTFPHHEKAAVVLGAAADDLYIMRAYELASSSAYKLLNTFPAADATVARAAYLVIGHSSFDLARFAEAESAYLQVLELLPADDKTRNGIVDNLAAAIYKQGEQANTAEDYQAAADHFLRVGQMASTSAICANAEFDGATALIRLQNWQMAAQVLLGFRRNFPGHALQPEVTKKIAFVYKEDGRASQAAEEYARIETESADDEVRREALQVAAQLYLQDDDRLKALEVYRRYVDNFPQPVEVNLETRNQIAEIAKTENDSQAYLSELRQIVAIDAAAGDERTPRTRYLAARAALVLAELQYESFIAVKLEQPFEQNLQLKQKRMKAAVQDFNSLMEYELGEITAAATFYLAEIYAHFSQSLMTSERPKGLNAAELEEYELAIEEQAYPFEEQAISVHESNLQLIALGVFNEWIEKSLHRLVEFVPARYDKPEESSGFIASLESFEFVTDWPAAPMPEGDFTTDTKPGDPEQAGLPAPGSEQQSEAMTPVEEATDLELIESESIVAPDDAAGDQTAQHAPEETTSEDMVMQ